MVDVPFYPLYQFKLTMILLALGSSFPETVSTPHCSLKLND